MTNQTTTLMPSRRMVAAASAAGLIGLMGTAAQACTMTHSSALMSLAAADAAPSPAAIDAALRDLWLGHVFYVRGVVQGTVEHNAKAAAAAEAAVVANARAIAAAIEPFYGAAARDGLFKLLAGHYAGIKSYLEAAVKKSKKGEDQAVKDITANAGEIATFLSGANPNLPKDDVMGLLQVHAGHHIDQIQQLIAKDYEAELATWAAMTQHMYAIADALSGAIAKQFPEKFKA